jgi:hypothetical protein
MVLRGENGTAAFPDKSRTEMVLLALQAFQVLFPWVHDWIPLGRLNDVTAVRGQDTGRRLVTVTLITSGWPVIRPQSATSDNRACKTHRKRTDELCKSDEGVSRILC